MSPIRTSTKRRSILKHRVPSGSSPATLARPGSDASPNRALSTLEPANSPISSSTASSSTTKPAGGDRSAKRSVQFSPNTSLTSVFETHAPDVYDRKPILPSPLTPEELEHAPAWFNLTLSATGPRSSSRPTLSPQRTRPRRINCNESRVPPPASPKAAMQFNAENVILEEDEEDDVALPQSPTTTITPFPSAPFASLAPRPLSQSAPARGRKPVLTSNTAHNLSHYKRWPVATALRARQPNVVAGNNARDLGRAAPDKETKLFSAPSEATESKGTSIDYTIRDKV